MSASPSLWWDDLGWPPPARPPLPGPLEAEVAVVGAGFTGLWTAWALAREGVDVVVLEAEHAGFGASGRNGGWVLGELADGTEIPEALDGLVAACREERIDCDLVRGGTLTVARSAVQAARLPARGQRLDAAGVAARVRVDGAVAGTWWEHCARVHPAKLAAGLAAAAERRGARIFERTPVTEVAPRRARTPLGDVRARWVVRATEGFSARLPGMRRELLPMNSAMIATEPLGEDVWAQLGWGGCETLLDGQHRYCYLQRTADGRVAIGGRGRPYRFASRTDAAGEVPAATVAALRARLGALFPMLRDVPVARGWAGVLGVTRDWRPFVRADPATGLAAAGGYAGEGVAAAHLAGMTLRDLLLGRDTALVRAPWVGRQARRWEPEPLRWGGVHLVYGLYAAADALEARTGRRSVFARAGDALAGRHTGLGRGTNEAP